MITVENVASRRQFREFAAIKSDPPLMRHEMRGWYTGHHWLSGITLWLARDGQGQACGRMITHHSSALSAKLGLDAGLFGAFEARDAEVARALLTHAQEVTHHAYLFGPVTPLPNVTGGVIRAGFEHPAFFDSAWNPEFVPRVLEEEGFSTWGIADTWEINVADMPDDPPTDAEWQERGLRLVTARRFRTPDIREALNASFAQLPYFTQISRAQWRAQTAGLGLIMDPKLVLQAHDEAGETQGFVLVIPDPIDWLRGKIWRRRRDAVLIVQGTRPEMQGRGVLGLLTRQLYAALRAGAYRRLRVTFIGRDNPASARVFAKIGGRPLHELSFYLKDLR
ncbi:MAG: hypothetical protein Q4G50_01895 [Corynebacterium sp.]|uniref:hypothetical protein n=1 Tax=Corynebacterium sp. TaxID=1720 RepID=UPI0026E018B8|nr:hypothetical protein [Corynebacterium sp.]MDO5668734.1 hypothetical protein [Corynebacterium sp.]